MKKGKKGREGLEVKVALPINCYRKSSTVNLGRGLPSGLYNRFLKIFQKT